MSSLLHYANSDSELDTMIRTLGSERCVVIFFFLPWCGACQKMAPYTEAIASKHPKTIFIKVDAERCVVATKKHKVFKVPLFILLNNKRKVDRVEGASPVELESKIKRIQNEIDYKRSQNLGSLAGPPIKTVPGALRMTDISQYMDKRLCKCINDLTPTTFQGFLEGKKLISGKGVGRLLLIYAFTEKLVLQSLKIKAPIHSGPKVLKFFINLGTNVEVEDVINMTPYFEVVLTEEDINGENLIDLRPGNLVGISNLMVFIPENMTKSRRIEIEHIIFNGAPLTMTTPPLGASNSKTYGINAALGQQAKGMIMPAPGGAYSGQRARRLI